MSIESLNHLKEFEQNLSHEVERKFIPVFPDELVSFRPDARPIEQFYISNPKELFSLRFRETFDHDGALLYEATLKDTGTVTSGGIDRIEITTPVDASLYNYYHDALTPTIRKLRAEPRPGITIDFYEDDSIQIESENEREWQAFVHEHGDNFVEITGDRMSTNEWKAHLSFRRTHEGAEALPVADELHADDIVNDIIRAGSTAPRIVRIGGRSGSGKSTIVREVRSKLDRVGLSSVVVSTDDYHRGTSWLRNHNGGEAWTHWDAPIVYDTASTAIDLERLTNGESIPRRKIDWSVAEPVITGIVEPADVIIIEGIYAQSPDIIHSSDLTYEMTTPLATCVGRRLLRDLRERPEFANPAKSLGYMLREAEPAYRQQSLERSNS